MIAVYGGCFNPPTIAHIKTVEAILKLKDITKVIIMPLEKGHYKNNLPPLNYRIEMLRICFSNEPNVKVSSLDMKNTHQITTIEYMQIFEELFDEEFAFVMGTDNLRYFTTWNGAEILLEKFHHIVVKRDDESVESIIEKDELLKKYKGKFITVNDIGVDIKQEISSTKARDYIKKCDVEGLHKCVTLEVEKYIKEKGLYI